MNPIASSALDSRPRSHQRRNRNGVRGMRSRRLRRGRLPDSTSGGIGFCVGRHLKINMRAPIAHGVGLHAIRLTRKTQTRVGRFAKCLTGGRATWVMASRKRSSSSTGLATTVTPERRHSLGIKGERTRKRETRGTGNTVHYLLRLTTLFLSTWVQQRQLAAPRKFSCTRKILLGRMLS